VKLLDVNVVLASFRDDHPDFTIARPFLDDLLATGEPFGVPWVVWWSFLQLATNPRVFKVPTPPGEAFEFMHALRAQPGHMTLDAGPRHMICLRSACSRGEASGDLIPDTVLAAIAAEHGCELVSFDRDFARFPDLRWTRPG
jgi:uncharacterized protein